MLNSVKITPVFNIISDIYVSYCHIERHFIAKNKLCCQYFKSQNSTLTLYHSTFDYIVTRR